MRPTGVFFRLRFDFAWSSCTVSLMRPPPGLRNFFRLWPVGVFVAVLGGWAAPSPAAVSDILKFESDDPASVVQEVRTLAPGTIIKVYAKPGKEVKQGELLAELDYDQQKYQMDLSRSQTEAEGGLRTSMSQLEQRKAELSEVQEQYRKRQVAKYRVDVGQALVDHAEGQLRSIKEQKEYFKIQYDYWVREYEKRFILSPFNGIVTEAKVTEGQGVGVAAHAFTISNPNAVIFSVSLPLEAVGTLGADDKVFVKSQGAGGMTQARVHEVLVDPASNGTRRILRVLVEGAGRGAGSDPSKALSKFDVFLPKNPPVGPSLPINASRTAVSAPWSGVRDPVLSFRSVWTFDDIDLDALRLKLLGEGDRLRRSGRLSTPCSREG